MKRLLIIALSVAGCASGEPGSESSLAQDPETSPPDEATGLVAPPVIDEPTIPHAEPGAELPAQRVQEFNCTPDAVGDQMVVSEVAGAPGDQLIIRPVAREQCLYKLVYAEAGGDEYTLSSEASGFLFTAARRDGDRTVVCTNDIVHSDLDGGRRHIDQVAILCATRTGREAWSPLMPAVVPDGDYAAWLRGLAPHPQGYAITWARDFSYQVMNLTDEGRPAEDGVYVTLLSLNGDAVAPVAVEKISDRTNPLADATFEKWEPGADEQAAMGEFIDFSDGPCPHGCSQAP